MNIDGQTDQKNLDSLMPVFPKPQLQHIHYVKMNIPSQPNSQVYPDPGVNRMFALSKRQLEYITAVILTTIRWNKNTNSNSNNSSNANDNISTTPIKILIQYKFNLDNLNTDHHSERSILININVDFDKNIKSLQTMIIDVLSNPCIHIDQDRYQNIDIIVTFTDKMPSKLNTPQICPCHMANMMMIAPTNNGGDNFVSVTNTEFLYPNGILNFYFYDDGDLAHLFYDYRVMTSWEIKQLSDQVLMAIKYQQQQQQDFIDRMNDISLLSDDARQQLYDYGNFNFKTKKEDNDNNLISSFMVHVQSNPDSPCVISEDELGQTWILTYRDLDILSKELSLHLIKIIKNSNDNNNAGRFIGIRIPRSPIFIISMLAILRTGAAYVALDPNWPCEVIKYMIDDAHIDIILESESFHIDRSYNNIDKSIIPISIESILLHPNNLSSPSTSVSNLYSNLFKSLQSPSKDFGKHDENNNNNMIIRSNDPAYMIYTSGTTGKPKGCVIEHGNVLNLIQSEARELINIQTSDRIIGITSPSFDASIWEMFFALCCGASIAIPYFGTNNILLGEELYEFLSRQKITIISNVPTILSSLDIQHWNELVHLHTVVSGGESCTYELTQRILKSSNDRKQRRRRFFNAYGPSETTVDACVGQIFENKIDQLLSDLKRSPSIGKPLNGVTAILLTSDQRRVCELGQSGELWIGGNQLARYYWKQPEQTANKFRSINSRLGMENKNNNMMMRMYRTGDFARWSYHPHYHGDDDDGGEFSFSIELEFLGRMDQQVKLNGVRVELSEISNVLESHDSVSKVIVQIREHPHTKQQQLLAYILFNNKDQLKSTKLTKLKKLTKLTELAEYIIQTSLSPVLRPSWLLELDHIPMTLTGKIDFKQLPSPDSWKVDNHNDVDYKIKDIEILINQLNLSSHAMMTTKLKSKEDSPAKAQNNVDVDSKIEIETKMTIRNIWCDVLKINPLSVSDDCNFFEAGGTSILAALIVNRVRKSLPLSKNIQQNFSMRRFLEHPVLKYVEHFQCEQIQCKQTEIQNNNGNGNGEKLGSTSDEKKHIINNEKNIRELKLKISTTDANITTAESIIKIKKWPKICTYICQTLGIMILIFLASYSLLVIYFGFFYLYANYGLLTCILLGSICQMIYVSGLLFFTVIMKWLLIGRYVPGQYHRHSWFFARWWFIHRLVSMCQVTCLWRLQGTIFINWWFKLMGSRIHSSAHIMSTKVLEFDLITIDADCVIEKEVLICGHSWLTYEILLLAPVHIKNHSILRDSSIVCGPAHLIANSIVEPLTCKQTNYTTNQNNIQKDDNNKSGSDRWFYGSKTWTMIIQLIGICLHFALFDLSIWPAFIIAYYFYELYQQSIVIVTSLLFLWTMIFIITFLLIVMILKCIFIGHRFRPCIIAIDSPAFLRKWFIDQLFEQAHGLLQPFLGTVWMRWWWRVCGATVGQRVELWSFATDYNLVTLHDESYVASHVTLSTMNCSYHAPEWTTTALFSRSQLHFHYSPVELGRRSFLSNDSLLQSSLSDGSLLGALSTIHPNQLRDNDNAHSKIWVGTSPSISWPSLSHNNMGYRPTSNQKCIRFICERIQFICFQIIIYCTIIALWYFFIWLFSPISISMMRLWWYCPLIYSLGCISIWIQICGLKWTLMYMYRKSEQSLWSSFFWQNRWVAIHIQLLYGLIGSLFQGTFMMNLYYQFLGCHIGENVYIDTHRITEYDLISIGSGSVIGLDVVLQGSVNENRMFKLDPSYIGNKNVINARSVILPNVNCGENVHFAPLSLAMKGSIMNSNTDWMESPAIPRY